MIEVEGEIVRPDFKAKERRLYTVIASRDAEVAALREQLEAAARERAVIEQERDAILRDLRDLRSKEYRRRVRRQKARSNDEADQ